MCCALIIWITCLQLSGPCQPSPTTSISREKQRQLRPDSLTILQKCQLLKDLVGGSFQFRITGENLYFTYKADGGSSDGYYPLAKKWGVLILDFILRDSLAYFNRVDLDIYGLDRGYLHVPLATYRPFQLMESKTRNSNGELLSVMQKLAYIKSACLFIDSTQSSFGYSEQAVVFGFYVSRMVLKDREMLIAKTKIIHELVRYYLFRNDTIPSPCLEWYYFDRDRKGKRKRHGLVISYCNRTGGYKVDPAASIKPRC